MAAGKPQFYQHHMDSSPTPTTLESAPTPESIPEYCPKMAAIPEPLPKMAAIPESRPKAGRVGALEFWQVSGVIQAARRLQDGTDDQGVSGGLGTHGGAGN